MSLKQIFDEVLFLLDIAFLGHIDGNRVTQDHFYYQALGLRRALHGTSYYNECCKFFGYYFDACASV